MIIIGKRETLMIIYKRIGEWKIIGQGLHKKNATHIYQNTDYIILLSSMHDLVVFTKHQDFIFNIQKSSPLKSYESSEAETLVT